MTSSQSDQQADFSKVETLSDLFNILGPSSEAFLQISRSIALRDNNALREVLENTCGSEMGDNIFNNLQNVMVSQMRFVIPQIPNPNNINTTSASAFAVSIPPGEGTQFIHALGKGDVKILTQIANKFLGEKAGGQFIENLKPQLDDFKDQ